MSLQSDFNAQHTDQEKLAMLLMMFGMDDSDIESCQHADSKVVHEFFVDLMLTDEVSKFLQYLRS